MCVTLDRREALAPQVQQMKRCWVGTKPGPLSSKPGMSKTIVEPSTSEAIVEPSMSKAIVEPSTSRAFKTNKKN